MAAGNGVDLATLAEALARIEAKVDRLGDGQLALTARVGNVEARLGNVEDNLLRVREVADAARKAAGETLRLVDTKLELFRLDMLDAVDAAAKSEGTHARTLATA